MCAFVGDIDVSRLGGEDKTRLREFVGRRKTELNRQIEELQERIKAKQKQIGDCDSAVRRLG